MLFDEDSAWSVMGGELVSSAPKIEVKSVRAANALQIVPLSRRFQATTGGRFHTKLSTV